MFSKFLAAAALTVVSAADVPLFSSNDDYDEINLNIRMLSNGTSAPAPVPTNVTVTNSMTGTFPAGTTAAKLAPGGTMYTDFNAGYSTYMTSTTGPAAGASACVVTAVTGSRRQLSESKEGRRLTETLTLSVTAAVTYASAAAATSGAAAISAFTFDTAALTALSNQFAGSLSGTSITTSSATATAPSSGGAAPAAAPSPSPSSNAAKVAVSTLAALSAFVASLL